MVAGPVHAVAEAGVGTDILRGQSIAAQKFDEDVVVGRGRNIGELLVRIVPLGDAAKSSFSTNQRLAVSRSGVRMATR